MPVDLHIHTRASDGLFSPQEVYEQAAAGSLDIMAITDHDTVAGFDEIQRSRGRAGPVVVPAVELTTICGKREVHVLGYFRDEIPARLRGSLDRAKEERQARIRVGIENLNRLGVAIEFEDLAPLLSGDFVGRSHLARALVEKGRVKSVRQAFERYLAPELEIVPNTEVTVADAIRSISSAGGVSIWAHPDLDLFDGEIRAFRDEGLDGVEVFTPRATGVNHLYIERVVEDLGLLKCGGSDWHGHPTQGPLGRFRIQETQIHPFLERIGVEPAASPTA